MIKKKKEEGRRKKILQKIEGMETKPKTLFNDV